MKIKIHTTTTTITVSSPYNSDFVTSARRLGGRFDETPKNWVFDIRDEERVRDLCLACYGDNGRVRDTVTLRVTWKEEGGASRRAISIHGRTIATAFGRDSGARTGEGIVTLAGGFDSGGSMKNWSTRVNGGTIVLVRDFPRAVALEIIEKQKPDDNRECAIEPETPVVDRDALSKERDLLLTRLAEINTLLDA